MPRLAPPAAAAAALLLPLLLCGLLPRDAAAVQPLPAWKNNSRTGLCSSTASCNNCNTFANCGLCNSITQGAYICLDTSNVIGGTGAIQTSDPRCDGAFTPFYGRCQACSQSATCGACIQQAGCVWCGATGHCQDSLTAAASCAAQAVPFGLSATAPLDFTQSAMDAACAAAVPTTPTPTPSPAASPAAAALGASSGSSSGSSSGGSGAIIGGVVGGVGGAAALALFAAWYLGYFSKAAAGGPLSSSAAAAKGGDMAAVSIGNPARA